MSSNADYEGTRKYEYARAVGKVGRAVYVFMCDPPEKGQSVVVTRCERDQSGHVITVWGWEAEPPPPTSVRVEEWGIASHNDGSSEAG